MKNFKIKQNNNKEQLKNSNNKKPFIYLIIISLLISFFILNYYQNKTYVDEKITLNQFIELFQAWVYSDILIDWNKAIATLSEKLIDNWIEKIQRNIVILPENDSLNDLWLLAKENQNIKTNIEVKDLTNSKFWADLLPTIITFVLFLILAIMVIWKMWWMANSAMNFGRSRARIYNKDKNNIKFSDVAWAEEEKEELKEIVDFLKNPQKYKDIWAKIPKWILLVWPPWTGKTLIAKAVAGESNVPFFSISWSEFVEMFVWVWASRVRDLFNEAKKMAPSIIFIDEIDAIWKKRWPWLWGWHDEREQTLNQILTEMDWFDENTNVIVIWATNRADVLDKALLRPGRFDRKVVMNLPNLEDREKILKVHSKWKPIAKDVNYKHIASQTVWFSWADLWNLINEAAIITARKNEKEITSKTINEAFEKVVMWLTKKSQVMNEQEKRITAYHEVWHALVWRLLPNIDPVHKISIISRWWALWVTWFLPERDSLLVSKSKYLDELTTLYWGRAAEEIFFWKENITTWASNDIERATKIARNMVTRFGMDDDVWVENFAPEIIEWNYLWAEWATKPFSEKTQELIDKKVKDILKEAYNRAIKLITDNKDLHIKISEDLIKKEEISREEFEAYFS